MTDYEKEKAERQAKAAELTKKLEKVIELLGQKVDREREADAWDARASSDKIYLHASEYGKWRVNVSGVFPRDKDGRYVTVYMPVTKTRGDGSTYESSKELRPSSITISSDKTAEQIAKDIKARFMPEYEKRLALVLERLQEARNYQDNCEQTLTVAIGRTLTAEEAKNREVDFYHITGHLGEIKASEKTIDLQVSDITPEQAHQIFKIISSVKRER